MKVGISGVPGSFSEQAAREYAERARIPKFETEYLTTVENVLVALEEGRIERGVFPIENSNGGIVIEAVYAMAAHRFQVEKMFEIEIDMNLLGRKGMTAAEITRIASHDQALKQCRMYLKRMWGATELVPYPDTALAAKDLAEGRLPSGTAVIASARAAELYHLDILEAKIQDLKFNYTVFVVATRV